MFFTCVSTHQTRSLVINVCFVTEMRKKCLIIGLLLTTTTVLYVIYNGYTTRIRPAPQSTRRQSYRFAVGVTELKQCDRASSLFDGKVANKPIYSEFKYRVSVLSVDAETGILLRVRETRNSNPTGGGSSLLALSDAAIRRRLCFYDDYFYVIWCPPPDHGQCSKVSVEMKFVNFSAYTIGYFPLQEGCIWEREICWNETLRTPAYVEFLSTVVPPWMNIDPEAPHTCHIDWIRGVNGAVINDQGVEIPLLEDDEFCLRIRRFRRIIMIGASHMRYKFNYIALKCAHTFGPEERKHGSANVKGTRYIEISYMSGIADLWTKHLEKINLTKRDAVIIQHGSHDFYSNSTRYVLSTSLPKYVDNLKTIKRHSVRLGFRLLAVTSPPLADLANPKTRKKIDNRNSFTLAALARLLHKKLSAARIDIFDEFAVILPHYNNNVRTCGGHYLCPDRKDGVVRGHTGIVAVHLLVRHLAGETGYTMC